MAKAIKSFGRYKSASASIKMVVHSIIHIHLLCRKKVFPRVRSHLCNKYTNRTEYTIHYILLLLSSIYHTFFSPHIAVEQTEFSLAVYVCVYVYGSRRHTIHNKHIFIGTHSVRRILTLSFCRHTEKIEIEKVTKQNSSTNKFALAAQCYRIIPNTNKIQINLKSSLKRKIAKCYSIQVESRESIQVSRNSTSTDRIKLEHLRSTTYTMSP